MSLNPQPMPPFPLLALAVALIGGLFLALGLTIAACTPAQMKAIETEAIPAVRATCVIARAVTTDGTVHELCATADELAPFVEPMIEARATDGPPEASALVLAAALEAPRRKVPARRHCALWTSTGGSAPDGGRENDGGEDRRTAQGRDGGAREGARGSPSLDAGHEGSDRRDGGP